MENNNPLISVYITNYNYGRFIKQSIDSLLTQSLQNFELFIIDDGSTDNSKEIIEQYSNLKNVSIIYQQNKGLNITNNIALRVSRGKYIMRLDADDFLESTALMEMSNILEMDKNLGLVFPDYFLVDSENHPIGEVKRFNFKNEVSLLDQPAHGACTMIRRDFLVNLGGYDESYSCQDGYELWIKFIAHYKVTNINKPLFSYRQHGNNLTTNEDRILETRSKIKENFINNKNLNTPKTLAVIAIRNTYINGENLPLIEFEGYSFLERLIREANNAAKVDHIVVTSDSVEIKEYFERGVLASYRDKCSFIERPSQFARINESLSSTINYVLESDVLKDKNFEAIMTLAIEYPYITSDVINDAINTLTIFDANSLMSVRPDNNVFYRHDGTGLKSILNQEKYTKLEREAIYKGVGGIVLSRVDSFLETGKMLNGKIGHIVVGVKNAISIQSGHDLTLLMRNKLTL